MIPVPELTLAAFAAAGFAAGPHCALMCGPLQGLQLRGSSLPRSLLLLHAGRVTGYALLGTVVASGGLLLFRRMPDAEWGLALQAAAAAVLVALGLGQLRSARRGCCQPREAGSLPSRQRPFLRGLAWAAMPCAALYAMLFIAMISARPLYAALLMAAFGLGTVPLLGAGGALLHRAGFQARQARGTAAALLILAGAAAAAGLLTGHPASPLAFCMAAG